MGRQRRPNSGGPPFLFKECAKMSFENLSDQYIIQMYESIRTQVRADAQSGFRLMGEPAKVRADELRQEIERRGLQLQCSPIEWPEGT
jgi:hypothetical protein